MKTGVKMIEYLLGAVAGVVERIRDEMRRRDEATDLRLSCA